MIDASGDLCYRRKDVYTEQKIGYLLRSGWQEDIRTGYWTDPLGHSFDIPIDDAVSIQQRRDQAERERLAMWNEGAPRRAEWYHVRNWWE